MVSSPPASVITSLPELAVNWKTSAPAPPVRVSLPVPPKIVSLPSPSLMTSSPLEPQRVSLPASPLMVTALLRIKLLLVRSTRLKIQYPYYIFMINFQTITISTCNRNSSEPGKGWIRSKYLEPFSIF